MNLKQATAVCLIALFAATLVVLIVRVLDRQTASRLEPKLDAILEELQTIRKQGGPLVASLGNTTENAAKCNPMDNALVVYYFHSDTRCPTCQAIESQAHGAIQSHFGDQLGRGEVVWKVLNYEQAAGKPLAAKFDVQIPVVVLAKMKQGEVQNWKRLDEVWALVGDKRAFAELIKDQTQAMLTGKKETAAAQKTSSAPKTSVPADLPVSSSPDIPIPK